MPKRGPRILWVCIWIHASLLWTQNKQHSFQFVPFMHGNGIISNVWSFFLLTWVDEELQQFDEKHSPDWGNGSNFFLFQLTFPIWYKQTRLDASMVVLLNYLVSLQKSTQTYITFRNHNPGAVPDNSLRLNPLPNHFLATPPLESYWILLVSLRATL